MSKVQPQNFNEREEEDQDALIDQLWCDNCNAPVAALEEPVEFKGNGLVLLEGRCRECGEMVIMELAQ